MKKTLTLLLLVVSVQLFAQSYPITGINISLPANPDANTANWGTGQNFFSINVSYRPLAGKLDPQLEECKILVLIKKSGSKVCGTYTKNSAPNPNFTSVNKIWNGPIAVSLLGQNCTLAPGEYELCVRFYGGPLNNPISEEKCKAFTIKSTNVSYIKPQNILPVDNSNFNTSMVSKPVIFKWTSVVPNPNEQVTYQLKVWKIASGQTPTQVINQSQPLVIKDIINVSQTIVTNLIDPSCLTPSTCQFVWQVQAMGLNGKTYGTNNGKSDFTVFKTGTENNNTTNTTACGTISTKTFAIGDEISLSDDFKMKFTAVPTGTNDSLTGVGTVRVKWLGIFNIKFKGIKINNQDKLCGGAIYTNTDPNQVYPVQFLVNATNVNNYGGAWTISQLKSVSQYIKSNKYLKPLVPAANQVDSLLAIQPINMPVGYFKNGDTSNAFGFTEMIFRPDFAEFEAIASLNTEKIFKNPSNSLYGTESIGLHGVGIKFTNSGLNGVVGSLKLMEPLVVSYANTGTENLKLTFNKEASGHIGNGIVFSGTNTDFWKYNIDVDMDLPKEWLVPVDTTKTNVSFNFQFNTSKWTDFLAEGTLPACIIPNAKGLGIESAVIAYDHSFVANPTGMVFPTGYAGNTNNFFSGFYLKNFKLTLPDELRSYADTSKKIEIIAQNLIIDEYGLSGKIFANNVINFPKANIGNLGASIDTVSVSFANGTLTEGKMLGKITLPLSSTDNVSNALNYSALFASNNSSIVFSLKPGGDITSKFLGEGKLQIDQTSTLNLTLSKVNKKRAISFDIDINGSIYYPSGKIIDPGSVLPLDLDLSCNFQHLGMTYVTGTADNFSFNPGQWSFASPQKKLSGFAFTITDVKPKIDPIGTGTEKQYLFKGGVELVAKINIGSENSNIAISGDTKIVLRGAIESEKYTPPSSSSNTGSIANLNTITAQSQTMGAINTNDPGVITAAVKADFGFLTQLKPKYLGVQVKSIHIDATMPAVKIKGSVEFYKNDVIYGNGFKGELQAKFTTLNMAIQAGAVFGNTKYIPGSNGVGFKYWMVEAQVNLPPPGIVFMTGVAFRGFGAGVYSRMNMTPPVIFNPATAAASTFGGAVFTPDATVKMGFKAKAIIATTPKEETFNGSVALSAEFNSTGGMNFIQFDGLFNCGAKIGEEAQAFANGAINVKYDFPNKIFSMNTLLNINKDPISTPTPISTRLYVNSKTNKWYFKAGIPDTPMIVRISGVDIQSYLMFGNDLGNDIPKGFMRETRNGFASIGYSLPAFTETATGDNKYQSAKGFAFGLGINYKTSSGWSVVDFHGSVCDCRRFLDINYSIVAGGEIAASLLQYANCTGFGKGWRAKMSIAVYAGAILNYNYSLPLAGSASGELGRVSAAAYATAEFPNPTFIEGELNGDFSIAGYGVGFHKYFVSGNQCAGTEQTPDPASSTYTQQNVADSLNYSLIKNIVTPGTTNVPRTTDFSVLLNYPYNEPFEVEEQQSSGEIIVRQFRANYTVTLKQDSLSGNVNQPGGMVAAPSMTANKISGVSTSTTTANTNANLVALLPASADMFGAKRFVLTKTKFLTNPLKANTSYRFQIVGKLEEMIGGVWKPVKKKDTNVAIVQTEKLWFKTNSDPVNTAISGSSNSLKKTL
ncbi:MAG: hypothetical protein M0Q26_03235 [Chitinophagaceae bacterium]|nr:hypothetical protein [Chitinophagaceae bacterium]